MIPFAAGLSGADRESPAVNSGSEFRDVRNGGEDDVRDVGEVGETEDREPAEEDEDADADTIPEQYGIENADAPAADPKTGSQLDRTSL
jgi:hypothetical protein